MLRELFYSGTNLAPAAIRPSTPVTYSKTAKAQQVFFENKQGRHERIECRAEKGKTKKAGE
jgi:hypothetical protein